jgi:hypothetical protein
MNITKKSFLGAVLVAAVVFVAAAAADHGGDRSRGHKTLLRQHLVGSILSDQPIHGVTRGGLPWQGGGDAKLERRGRFEARIRGLIIPSLGTAGPVTSITISLYCSPDSNPAAAFTTQPVPLSQKGNARVRQHVTVPSRCLAPVLLVHPNGGAGAYIAATGFTS